jgi:hypothetical protein
MSLKLSRHQRGRLAQEMLIPQPGRRGLLIFMIAGQIGVGWDA